jgi:5-methylcytosine-specific restriction protein A
MKLPLKLRSALNAIDGAGSHVTDREKVDGQLTLAEDEKAIVLSVLGSSIYRGRVSSNREKATHSISLYKGAVNQGKRPMSIVYPKDTGDEIRLYFSQKGFYPNANDHWYTFIRNDGSLAIGYCSQEELLLLSSDVPEGDGPEEENDDEFSEQLERFLQGKPSTKIPSKSGSYNRDPEVAGVALENAGFKCAVDESHTTFTSKRTGKPFVEAHHIVPMSASAVLPGKILDRTDNIAALCPTCHRKIHYGLSEDRANLVSALLNGKQKLLDDLDVTRDQVLTFYSALASIKSEKLLAGA